MYTITNLFLSPCTFHKTNMLLLCYMTLPIPESLIFFFVSYNYMTYDCDICDYPVISVTHNITSYFFV